MLPSRPAAAGLNSVRADVSNQEEVRAAVAQAAAHNGRIDILCNNAAYISSGFHGALESTDEEWRNSINVTLMGTHYFTKAVLPYMIAQKQGSIVNVVSIQAMEGMMTSVAYTATKAALLGYTMSVCYDYGLHNIRINSLCPGPIQTRISAGADDPHYIWQCDQTTLGRVGHPNEVAWAALFLASDESSFVTGSHPARRRWLDGERSQKASHEERDETTQHDGSCCLRPE